MYQMNTATPAEQDADGFRRPPLALLAAELPRAGVERAIMASLRPLLDRAPHGDGHPVIVLPGYIASDKSTRYLRQFLRSRGYHVHGWRLGSNMGPTDRILTGLEARFAELSERHGQKCSLIGWSLGGIFARQIAVDKPHAVRQVITLGAPFRLTHPTQSYGGLLYQATSFSHSRDVDSVRDLRLPPTPLSVPSTAIYSRSDGAVSGLACQDGQGPDRESIEVVGSHCGLGHNPAVLAVVANRLALPEGQWAPFAGTPLARTLCMHRAA